MSELWKTLRWAVRHPLWFILPKFLYDNQMFVPLEEEPMADKLKKRAREIQKNTGWSYTECLRLAKERITPEGLEVLKGIRAGERPGVSMSCVATSAKEKKDG